MINNGENGYLVDVFDDEMFKQKLQYLMKNDRLCQEMRKNAINSIQKFDRSVIAQKYYNFITSQTH